MRTGSGLRVGVLGCGYWGSKHVRVLHGIDQVDSVIPIDASPDRLDQVARSFAGLPSFTNLDAALPYVDAVVVATPPTTHESLALAAIKAGKHVLVEKPLTVSTTGARRVVDEAAAAGVVLMVGHTYEYNPAVWKLREIVQNGELGNLYYLDSARLNLGLYQSDVNVIFDLAPHDISITNHILGRKPTSVQAWGSRHAHRQFEDVAYLRLSYEDDGLSANIHVSWLDPCKVRRVTAVGSQKMAVYNDLATDERLRIHDKGVSAPQGGEDFTQPPMSYRYGDILSPYLPAEEPLAVQDRHFVECVVDLIRPQTDGENGLAVVEVIEAAQLSLMEGRRVWLDEVADPQRGSAGVVVQLASHGSPPRKSGEGDALAAR